MTSMKLWVIFCGVAGLLTGLWQIREAKKNPTMIEEEERVKSFFDVI